MSEVSQIRVKGTLYDIKDAVARLATGAPAVASTAAGMTDTSKIYVYTGTESGYTTGNWYYHDGTSWVSGGIYQSSGIETDSSLSVSGAAADAKVTGDAINNVVYVGTEATDSHTQVLVSPTSTELDIVTQADFDAEISDLKSQISGGGLTADIKQALMDFANAVAFKSDSPLGQTLIDALEDALYPPANLVSISAVYTQSGTVYDTDSLNDLKSDLVVTAHYDDSSTETITNYALSGTLEVGTSTITVSYGGKTTTFNVTVTLKPYEGYGAITLADVQNNAYIDENGDVQSYSGSYYDTEYFSLVGSADDLIYSSSSNNFRVCLYDSNKTFTRQVRSRVGTANNYICLLTKTSSEVYYRLSWGGSSSDTFSLYDGTAQDLVMEIGDIDSSTGADKTETKRIRSVGYIPVSGKMNTLNCPFASDWTAWASSGCGFFFRCYDSSKSFVGSLLDSNAPFRGNAVNKTLPTNTAYVRIVMQKNNNAMSEGFSQDVINPMVIGTTSYMVTEE